MIGNCVLEDLDGFPMNVVGIYSDVAYLDFEGNEGDMWERKDEELYPMEINREILTKIGMNIQFNELIGLTTMDKVFEDGTYLYVFLYSGLEKAKVRIVSEENECECYLKYVHELQNLFKSVTNNKLEIKL